MNNETRLTAAEWKVLRNGNGKKPRFSLMALIPDKLTETGAQMTYLGAAGLTAVGVVALFGPTLALPAGLEGGVDAHLNEAITVFTAMLFGGGGYRQANKRHEAAVDRATLEEDFGALPDEDEFGPDRG